MDTEHRNDVLNYDEQEKQDKVNLATKYETIVYDEELTKQGNYDDDSLNAKKLTADEYISDAETFVRDAALYIGLRKGNTRLDHLCQTMRDELVISLDQLSDIGSAQWQMMGAPVGLVATLRHQLSLAQRSKEKASNLENEEVHNLSAMSDDVSKSKASSAKPAPQQSRPKLSRGNGVSETPNDHFLSDQDAYSTSTPRSSIFKRMTRILFKVTNPFDWGYPALYKPHFKHASLHTMTNASLKDNVMCVSEMWFVALSLMLGVIIALWEVFPSFEDDEKLGALEVAFNCLAYLGSLFCLLAIALSATTAAVARAIHESKFKRFYLLLLNVSITPDAFMVLSFSILHCLLLLTVHAKNKASISANDLSHGVDLLTITMYGIFLVFAISTYTYINTISRIALHCRLLEKESEGDEKNSEEEMSPPISAKEYELQESDKMFKDLIVKPDEVIDAYFEHNQKDPATSKQNSRMRHHTKRFHHSIVNNL